MRIYEGVAVCGGIAMGTISVYTKNEKTVECVQKNDSDNEIERFRWAREVVEEQLQELYEEVLPQVGEANAAIFEAHQMLARDETYIESVEHIIETQKVNAEYAVYSAGKNFAAMFETMDDGYMRARAADVLDVSKQIIDILSGTAVLQFKDKSDNIIIVAEELTPSETVMLDRTKVVSIVNRKGSVHSHAAILARSMGIPALVSVNFGNTIGEDSNNAPENYLENNAGNDFASNIYNNIDGKKAIVDGYTGRLIVEPDDETYKRLKLREDEDIRRKKLLYNLKGKENVTMDGRTINVLANIGGIQEVMDALVNDAGGIGLFRSEYLYLESKDYPTEDEQFNVYKTIAESMAGRKVIIRTLDIGADKQADYFCLDKENNPAMGLRGIRFCLKRQDIFKTQLRAILRASIYGNIAVMFPMITSLSEVEKIKQIMSELMLEFDNEKIPYKKVEFGIMIETPAAALISDELAKEVDFFSIGTNDLTQYTLAMDRQNEDVKEFYEPYHEGVLKLIKMVVDNGHASNCTVGICGELAADKNLTETFINMGVDELSVSPCHILEIRERIRSI